jgi:anthranilate synthase component 2
MKILVLDNYDSFTYNLVYILKKEGLDVDVIRNDKIEAQDALKYDGILLSPGPGIPEEAGNMPEIIATCASQLPIMGICLGHQAICEYANGSLINRDDVLHGMQTPILKTNESSIILEGLEEVFDAGRYHSWEINPNNKPEGFSITAVDEQGSIMAIESAEKKLFGLQFHPESIMTPGGKRMIQNFLQICKNQ